MICIINFSLTLFKLIIYKKYFYLQIEYCKHFTKFAFYYINLFTVLLILF